MQISKILTTGIAINLLLGGLHPAFASGNASKDQSHTHKGYYKPGAAVALSYDYDGETRPGELEHITLNLEHHYNDGYISARLLKTHNLEIMSHQIIESEKLSTGSTLQFPVQLSGTKIGEHFISLEVIHESLSGARSLRVLSLPIQIGSVEKSKSVNAAAAKSTSSNKKGLIILEAQEIIK